MAARPTKKQERNHPKDSSYSTQHRASDWDTEIVEKGRRGERKADLDLGGKEWVREASENAMKCGKARKGSVRLESIA